MKWSLKNNIGKNSSQQEKIKQLLEVILTKFEEYVPEGPLLGYKELRLELDQSMGQAVSWSSDDKEYVLKFNAHENELDKISFQFARGLAHIYVDPRYNNWFTEVICHVSSIYYLDYIVDIWEEHGLQSTIGNNYENFLTYKNFLISGTFNAVDLVQYQVSNKWIKHEVTKLRNNPNVIDPDRILLIAIEILPLFKMFDNAWALLPFIGRSTIPVTPVKAIGFIPTVNSKPDFGKLEVSLPDELRAIFIKIKLKILE